MTDTEVLIAAPTETVELPEPSAETSGPSLPEPFGAEGGEGGEGFWPPTSRRRRWLAALGRPEVLATLLVVAACVVFTFAELQPSQLFKNTTPAGGDMGAHVWLPAYIKRVLLPHFQIFGWTMDWYGGFPALTYYFPLPMVGIALISYVIPYDVAFKLVSVSGLIALPIAAWAFGRLSRMPFPGPACLAVAATAFLFSRDFTIYGGNIASTMAGEFSFSISLSIALVFLGLVARGLETGKGRAIAALLLACTALCHVLPAFFAVGGALIALLLRFNRKTFRWLFVVFAVGGLLAAFWALPFELRLNYATNMGYQKITTYVNTLFPKGDLWLFLIAGVGATLALVRRSRFGIWVTLMAVGAAFVFIFAPQARLWNARALPFWFLCLYLLVGVAIAEGGRAILEALEGRSPLSQISSRHLMGIPVVALLAGLVWVGFPLRILPFGHLTAGGKYDWLGITSADSSFVPDWVTWNYSGYESPGKSSKTQYFALIAAMKKIGATDGCGRAMWEYEPALNDMGTPDALMLLPYWTNGCIGSMEGLYYESSATTPYHFLNAAELSEQPSDPMRGLDYPTSPNVVEGVEHLQMYGVRYFMAISSVVQQQADADSQLKLVTTVGPFPTQVTEGNNTTTEDQTWKIYRVLNSPLVSPLQNQPVVAQGVVQGGTAWLNMAEAWYLNPQRWKVYEAATGPKSWLRVTATDANAPQVPLPPVHVTDIQQTEETISFNVDNTGVPVLVKTSYYPNWHVSGASGVYRVTPNLMVVIPTSHHVRLYYANTTLNWVAFGLSGFGVLCVVFLLREPARALANRRDERRLSRASYERDFAARGALPETD
ncbi:MAG: hypothetical protein ACRDYC_04605 [Acidimicrobiales bacterium]